MDEIKSQARWNKIYQKKLRKQQEREQQKKTDRRQAKSVKKIKLYKESITL